MEKQKIVILTGAGMSAESGINTFRDANGLWENHDIMEVASPEGWNKNMELVLSFYNQRRKELFSVVPNVGHLALAGLEKKYDVRIITQNVDDLHERAQSQNVMHLHGELRKVRSTGDSTFVINWDKDINLGDKCSKGYQLRPHIVWFGEDVPMIRQAALEVERADIIIIVGTSMQVYPAAGLVGLASSEVPVYYIDPNPSISHELSRRNNLVVIKEKASIGIPLVINEYLA